MTKEDMKEVSIKGLFIGLILFLSTLIELLINKDMQHLQIVGTFLIPIILAYCLLGMFIRWMVYRSTIRKEGFHLFTGAAVVYWIFMFSAIFMAGAYFIPQVIRYIVVANTATLLLMWFLNCVYLKNIAKELNSGLAYYNRTLVEDLQEKPQTEDIFIEDIENYCKKNHLSLEILEYGIPAKIKMNNVLYIVKLGQYYSMIGTLTYTLEFHNVVSEVNNNIN
ncbi:DUF4318 domain-containing protein [Candidatus Clostridium radicumherbarum]|uniref:DUF4318 domain-containing protein n=1 Tax=Candidatus Clostridium radicumherbarum TaxID=3381662 RepID=A0ABW8TXF1_9CLOT